MNVSLQVPKAMIGTIIVDKMGRRTLLMVRYFTQLNITVFLKQCLIDLVYNVLFVVT